MKKELSIEMYFKPESYLPLSMCIAQIEQILKIQHSYMHKSQDWYLCGTSKKKSSIHKLFEKEGVTEVGLKKLTQEYKKNHLRFSVPIWDKDTEEASLIYILSEKSFEKRFMVNISINFTLDVTVIKLKTIIDFVDVLARQFSDAYIVINGLYDLDLKVFPDRLSAGWMMYLPKAKLTHEMVPESSHVTSVTNQEGQVTGSLVVTLPHFFDEENRDDIKTVNRVDIRLRELGILPLYADM